MPTLVCSAVRISDGFAQLSDGPRHGAEPIWDDKLMASLEGSGAFGCSSERKVARC